MLGFFYPQLLYIMQPEQETAEIKAQESSEATAPKEIPKIEQIGKKAKLLRAAKVAWWTVASSYRRFTIWLMNPGRLLRWLLILVVVAFSALVALHRGYLDGLTFLNVLALKQEFVPTDWLPTITVCFAVAGWLVNSIVTIRNSVKQHTINTLLQSRLSKTYMDEGDAARAALQPYVPKKLKAPADFILNHKDRNSIDYVLNYIEFIAVGIMHGDLHEGVMKDSMRGIVTGFTGVTILYINELRKTRPRTFQHLMWLRKRWKE